MHRVRQVQAIDVSEKLGSNAGPAADERVWLAAWRQLQLWRGTERERASAFGSAKMFGVITLVAVPAGIATLAAEIQAFAIVCGAVGGLTGIGWLISRGKARNLRGEEVVTSVRRVYWPVLHADLGGGSVYSPLVAGDHDLSVQVSQVQDPEGLINSVHSLSKPIDRLAALEPVESFVDHGSTRLYGLDASLLKAIHSSIAIIEGAVKRNVRIPACLSRSELTSYLNDEAHQWAEQSGVARGVDVDLQDVMARIAAADGVYQSSNDESFDIDEVIESLEANIDGLVERLEIAHGGTLRVLGEARDLVEKSALLPAFNWYQAPDTQEDRATALQTASKQLDEVQFDEGAHGWKLVETGESVPVDRTVAINRFRDELFYPILDQFRASYHSAILEIDRDIENQLEALRHEQEVKRRDLESDLERTAFDRRQEFRRFEAQANSIRAQVLGMTSTLEEYQQISSQIRAEFNDDCDKATALAKQRTEQVLQRYDEEFAEGRERSMAHEQSIMQYQREEEERRHREVTEQMEGISQGQQEIVAATKEQSQKLDQQTTQMEKVTQASMMSDEQKHKMQSQNPFGCISRRWAKNDAKRAAGRVG